jgi:hypothetical protein
MKVAYSSEIWAALPTSTRCNDPRAELTSIMRNCVNISHFRGSTDKE